MENQCAAHRTLNSVLLPCDCVAFESSTAFLSSMKTYSFNSHFLQQSALPAPRSSHLLFRCDLVESDWLASKCDTKAADFIGHCVTLVDQRDDASLRHPLQTDPSEHHVMNDFL